MEIACKQAAIFTEHIMFHAVYADGLSLMFALVANVEHGFIAANLYVLHRQLPTLILSAEILQHVPAFLDWRSEEHTSELQSLMRISYAVFCLKKKTNT